MSRFFSLNLTPYTPGEQPQDKQYIKLNTNESPFPPCKAVEEAVKKEVAKLSLYPDPECGQLSALLAKRYGVGKENVIINNGSDETLLFAFMAFCGKHRPAVFPDITYGFYSVFASLLGVPFKEIPLREDFSVNVSDYIGAGKTVFLANPNAPTGLALPVCEIEKIVKSNPENVVVIDEAYVDFGAESCIPLIKKYENLLVVGTFSKSRSLAGARLGFGIGSEALIKDLNTVKYSTNPYNINRLSAAAGIASLKNDEYHAENCKTITQTRNFTEKELLKLGFSFPRSSANFIFAKHPKIAGKTLYLKLKEKGILIRHFDKERIREYNRITIGTRRQMEILLDTMKEILEEQP